MYIQYFVEEGRKGLAVHLSVRVTVTDKVYWENIGHR